MNSGITMNLMKILQKDSNPLNQERLCFTSYLKYTKTVTLEDLLFLLLTVHTSNISSFVDYHIQDSAKSLKSYVKDTTDFINKTSNSGELPEESYLVTMDVKALYMNIPNDEGLLALKKALDQKQNQSMTSKVIVTLMSLILTLNNFVFNDKNYLQVKGCVMGTISAPSYANIFMGKFEESHIYPYIRHLCKLYLRYIDDLFLIWTGTKQQFEDFICSLNNQHPSIKFSYQISNTSIYFLDTTVYIKNRKLHTTIFTKPTDKQNYLHPQDAQQIYPKRLPSKHNSRSIPQVLPLVMEGSTRK